MSVMRAAHFFPARRPIRVRLSASSSAPSSVFMKAPSPHLTSSTMTSDPEASFFDMIELTIRGIDGTVPVTSRRAYSFLSAGARSAVCPMMAMPWRFTFSKNCSSVSSVLKPGKLSSLSIVPPVCPRPRPDILAIFRPQAATIGQRTRLVLSPTPPVECLSALMPSMGLRSSTSPELTIAVVRSRTSRSSIPFSRMAMHMADI